MRRARMSIARTLVLIAVNVGVFAVLSEMAALGLYFAQTGRLFYLSPPRHDAIPETARDELTADGLHPYFGPIHRPGVRPESNNVGFTSPYPFPVGRSSPDDFVVGIFGGSVGEQFCERGASRMIETLGADASFAGRRVVPVCLSHEGYKQPQQLLILAWALSVGQQFNLVVNIDGFNEVALGSRSAEQGRDISMPSPLHLDPLIALIDRATLTPAMVESLAAISRHKAALNELAARIPETRPAAIGIVREYLYRWRLTQYQAQTARFAALTPVSGDASLLVVTPPLAERDADRVYADIAALWARASMAMHALLAAQDARYLHVLQPNQYFTSRQFGPEEARIALDPDTPFKHAVELGYPHLMRAAGSLQDAVALLDATTIFDQERAPVYDDDCCHYTDLGYRILADAIAAHVLDPGPPAR